MIVRYLTVVRRQVPGPWGRHRSENVRQFMTRTKGPVCPQDGNVTGDTSWGQEPLEPRCRSGPRGRWVNVKRREQSQKYPRRRSDPVSWTEIPSPQVRWSSKRIFRFGGAPGQQKEALYRFTGGLPAGRPRFFGEGSCVGFRGVDVGSGPLSDAFLHVPTRHRTPVYVTKSQD